ncbi:MAG: methionyl-tRNA formyltransferase, partial [Sphingobium sp.]
HASLLPRWRGAAPIQRAILAGDAETGVTIMQMEAGLDTGPMRATIETMIDGKTAGALTDELATKGAALMVRVLADPAAYPAIAQPEDGVTYARKIEKAEARLDFADAAAAERQVRAFNPAPGAFFELGGERVRILAASAEPGSGEPGTIIDDALGIACANGILRPLLVQRAGKAAMAPVELLRGYRIPAGTRLG